MKPVLKINSRLLHSIIVSIVVFVITLALGVQILGAEQWSRVVAMLGPTPTPHSPPPTVVLPTRLLVPTPAVPPTPWPTATPLPAIPPGRRDGFWTENITLGSPISFGKNIKNQFKWVGWSPDGTKLAFNSDEGRFILDDKGQIGWPVTSIAIVDEDTQSVSSLTQGFWPHWSPDGNQIAYLAYLDAMVPARVRIINTQTRKVTEFETFARNDEFTTLAWLSSSELAFFKGEPLVFDARMGQIRRLLDPSILAQVQAKSPLKYLTASPATGVFGVGSKSEILLLEWINSTARLLRRIPEGLDSDTWSISPDGELLAYVSLSTSQLKVVSVRNEAIRIEMPTAGRGSPWDVDWSPDSKSLLYLDVNGGKMVNKDGSGLRSLPLLSGEFLSSRWSPRGNQILFVRSNGDLLTVSVVKQ
jgi:dipeptidyl aminopeptidase/acylaminoacyl peptidase